MLMLSVTLAFMAQYSWWRIAETLPPPAFNLEYAVAIGFLVAETAGAFAAALSILFLRGAGTGPPTLMRTPTGSPAMRNARQSTS
jgi:hypothetical protein